MFIAFALPTYLYLTFADYNINPYYPIEAIKDDTYVSLLVGMLLPPVLFHIFVLFGYGVSISNINKHQYQIKSLYCLLSPYIFIFLSLLYGLMALTHTYYFLDLRELLLRPVFCSLCCFIYITRRPRLQFQSGAVRSGARAIWQRLNRQFGINALVTGAVIGVATWCGPAAYLKVWAFTMSRVIEIPSVACHLTDYTLHVHAFIRNSFQKDIYLMPDNIRAAIGYDSDKLREVLKTDPSPILHLTITDPQVDRLFPVEAGKTKEIRAEVRLTDGQRAKFSGLKSNACVLMAGYQGPMIMKETYIDRPLNANNHAD